MTPKPTPGASEPERGPVRVPREILDGIEAARQSGLTNMLDRTAVAEIAGALGFDDAAHWVRDHRDLYAHAIFHGFELDSDGSGRASPG